MKAVIFEDNLSIQHFLDIFFKKRGFEVYSAPDATDAVAFVQQHDPNVILMDIVMPGKDGILACVELRQAGIKAPIIVLTSKSFAEDKDFALKAGVSAYLLKPFNPAQLEAILQPLIALK